MKPFFTLLIILTILHKGFGQDIPNMAGIQDTSVVYEKVYLHVDREYYAPGDTIWFKSYLVSGMTNKLEAGYKNVYVQLISPVGKVVSNRMLMSVIGTSHGDITLNDSLASGQYTLRAFTKYLENFEEKSCYHKRIWIGKSGDFDAKDSTLHKKPELGEILFFPEGGNLVANAANHIAFKAIAKDGKGMEVSGTITNIAGEVVSTFKTSFMGMGQFVVMPKDSDTYKVSIDNYPEYNCQLPQIQKNGLALHCEQGEKELMVSLKRNYQSNRKRIYYLGASHKGTHLFSKTIEMDGFDYGLKLSKSQFPHGISKITVLNEAMDILAERLIFVSDGQLTTVKINTDKKVYQTREKVSLNIEPMLAENDSILSTLSVAAVNEGYFSEQGNTQSIQSYLLLDSELKGAIESPAMYFLNEESMTSTQKLDLLMLVQGWRSYYWDDIIKSAPKDLTGWNDAGVKVSGVMKHLFRKKVVASGKIQLSSFSPLIVEKSTTDSLGRFCFERLFLKDSAEVRLSGVNENKGKSIEIIPDLPLQPDTVIVIDSTDHVLSEIGLPLKYARMSYFKQLTRQDFDPDKGSILLDGVKVSAKNINTIKQVDFFKSSIYTADDSYIITPADYKYGNTYNFLFKKAGLPVSDWRTLASGTAIRVVQYNLDGEFILGFDICDESQKVLDIPIKNIYQIDIDKKVNTIRALVFVYTKKFDLAEPSNSSVRGTAIIRVRGFQRSSKFYSPTYTPENINNTLLDYRPTLYWSPEVEVKNGKAAINFFTCDNLSNYVIIVEGISKEGKICFGTKQFTVNKIEGN